MKTRPNKYMYNTNITYSRNFDGVHNLFYTHDTDLKTLSRQDSVVKLRVVFTPIVRKIFTFLF